MIEHFRKWLLLRLWSKRGLRVAEVYKELVARDYWTSAQLSRYQDQELQKFIHHCYNNVPYYKRLFDDTGIKPEDIRSQKDLHKIPVLTKDIVRAHQKELLAINIPVSSMKKTNTSGSTGKPLTLYSDVTRATYLTAGLWRIYNRCGWVPGERIAYIWGFQHIKSTKNSLKKSIKEYFTGATYLNAWMANEDDYQLWAKRIARSNIKVIVCYASSGSRFANWLLENNIKIAGIKGVFCTSEKLYKSQEELIAKAFNAKVFNLYGCGEVNHVACTCEYGNMHVNEDMTIVEVGHENDNGDTPLILTGLRNLAMPFLRYVNGDAGKLKTSSTCACGRHSVQMDLEVARLSDVFTFSDGKKYPSLYFILRIYQEGFDGVELFQFYQDKIDHIYFYVVKNKNYNAKTEVNLANVIQEIAEHTAHQATIELVFVDYIEQSKSSKHYYAKSDVK